MLNAQSGPFCATAGGRRWREAPPAVATTGGKKGYETTLFSTAQAIFFTISRVEQGLSI